MSFNRTNKELKQGTAQRNFEAEWLKQYEKFLQEA